MKETAISFASFMKGTLAAICLFAALCASGSAKWKNLDDKSHIAGEKLSTSDLVGRVVLVYYWDVSHETSVRVLVEIEKVWNSFKAKKFIVVGSYIGVRNETSDANIKETLLSRDHPARLALRPEGLCLAVGRRTLQMDRDAQVEVQGSLVFRTV